MNNFDRIDKCFRKLQIALVGFEARALLEQYGDDYWDKGVRELLDASDLEHVDQTGSLKDRFVQLDVLAVLKIVERGWQKVFSKKLSRDCKGWAIELKGTRCKNAHRGIEEPSDDYTARALDTMARLCDTVDSDAAEYIRAQWRDVVYGSEKGSVAAGRDNTVVLNGPAGASQAVMGEVLAAAANSAPSDSLVRATSARESQVPLASQASGSLPSWRDVMQPHPDVAQGRYSQAEFAADLAQVAAGKADVEYQDPVEFFNRTYVTEGMKGLLVQSLQRVCGLGGEPVIQLKTAFGGGKTHSMLALYHLLRGKMRLESVRDTVGPVLAAAGLDALPSVPVAVVVGTYLNPAQSHRPAQLPGVTVNTVWGDIAAQLAIATGKPELYRHVKAADAKHVSPGSAALRDLFDECGPCLVLMDELVAYAKKLPQTDGVMPAGTIDNFVTFVQELTEAARQSKTALVVASIPESNIEIGGDSGRAVLEAIEHTFGRMESIWKPVNSNEGFEVVRRRLFLDCRNPALRDQVVEAYSQLYRENTGDFPVVARETEYLERMRSCYPIHPEVFDRLYNEWATLERFQRTRGVLRLMAAVIHELWMRNDPAPMIMPGSIPLDVPKVRDELVRYLPNPDSWNAIVDKEVDGKGSVPFAADQENPRYGRYAASRRVARAVFLGSAADVSGQTSRGVESSYVRLGAVQPGDNIPVFNDARDNLLRKESFLYGDPGANRFWFDTRPTLRKVAEDRASRVSGTDAASLIRERLQKGMKKDGPFQAVNAWPQGGAADVPDEQALRLVVLPLSAGYKKSDEDCEAMKWAASCLEDRGSAKRTYKNMLAFLAPDQPLVHSLVEGAKSLIAWQSILDDADGLNLTKSDMRQASDEVRKADTALDTRIAATWSWLLLPSCDPTGDLSHVIWSAAKLDGSAGAVRVAARVMANDGTAIETWAPALLKAELDRWLWKSADHIQVKMLWAQLCSYLYLSRLSCVEALYKAIEAGVSSGAFGIAGDIADGKYVDLRLGKPVYGVALSDYLVKADVAKKQLEAEKVPPLPESVPPTPDGGDVPPHDDVPPEPPTPPVPCGPRGFHLEKELDAARANREFKSIMEDIVEYLATLDGDYEVNVSVVYRGRGELSKEECRTLEENSKTLNARYGFDA